MRVPTWLLILGLLVACGPGEPAETNPSGSTSPDVPSIEGAEPSSSEVPSPLAGTNWRLVELQSMDDATGTRTPDDPDAYILRLDADGSASLRLDCNRGTGRWSVEPGSDPDSGSFTFGPLAVTRALCPPPTLGEELAAQAEYVRSFLLQDGRLYLSLLADGGIQVWEPTGAGGEGDGGVPQAPEEGGPMAWTVRGDSAAGVSVRSQADAASEEIVRHPPGTTLDNLGCERVVETVWCYVQELGGGPVGYVTAAEVAPAISPDGSVAMGPDDSALRAGRGEFDATGTIPCAREAEGPTTSCPFGVARAGGGYATVVVELAGGGERTLYFSLGRPIGLGTSEADPTGEFSARREGDLHLIHVGAERYEVPDAAVLGG